MPLAFCLPCVDCPSHGVFGACIRLAHCCWWQSSLLRPRSSYNGNINGTITDPSGAVIVGSSVTLTNTGTSDTRTTTTNASGLYQFTDLPPGSYRIVAQQQGYQKTVREPIDLQVAGTVQINIALAVGSATEQVVVTSATPLIQAESDSLGAVVDQRETNEMPLNGRNPMSLVALVPSVIPQGQAQQTPTRTNPFGWGTIRSAAASRTRASPIWMVRRSTRNTST